MGKGSGGCGDRAPLAFPAETNAEVHERAHGVAAGMAVGDALGASLEFMSREQIMAEHGGPLREIVGGGVWGVRPGQVTDDTEMALGLARSLHLCGGYHPSAAVHQYLQWFKDDPVDVGATCAYVLRKAEMGYPAEWAAAEFHDLSGGMSAGNGALMRQAPLAIYYRHDLDMLEEAIRADTKLTHHDELASDCSVYFSRQLARLLVDPDAELESSDHPLIHEAISADRLDVERRVDEQMGFCLTALAVAVFATKHAKSYEQGMTWAVNLGGDADTNGAVAGALLGAKFGESGIPSRWTERIEVREELAAFTDWSLSGRSATGVDASFAQPVREPREIQIPRIPDANTMSIAEIEDVLGVARGTFDEDEADTLRAYLSGEIGPHAEVD